MTCYFGKAILDTAQTFYILQNFEQRMNVAKDSNKMS